MANEQTISVMVVYALANHQEVIAVELPANSTVERAINESGILQKFSEIDLTKNVVGIYGMIVEANKILKDHDRVEINRPLAMDPMQARRKRAGMQS